jgi:3-oxoacyl-[acyl-carrier protein] reductase
MEIEGKVVVITGGGRGVGRSLALAFAREGARIGLVARTVSQLSAVCDEVKALGAEAISVPTDLTEPDQIRRMAKSILDRFGTVDVLINNAGSGNVLAPIQDTTLEYLNEMLNLNARGTFLVTQAFLPTMLAKKSGAIFLINSVVAKKGVSGASAYCASKAAMAALGESLQAEVSSQGIRVTNVFCEPINTWLRWTATPNYPRDRVIEPEDVAQTVLDILKMPDTVLVNEVPVRRL